MPKKHKNTLGIEFSAETEALLDSVDHIDPKEESERRFDITTETLERKLATAEGEVVIIEITQGWVRRQRNGKLYRVRQSMFEDGRTEYTVDRKRKIDTKKYTKNEYEKAIDEEEIFNELFDRKKFELVMSKRRYIFFDSEIGREVMIDEYHTSGREIRLEIEFKSDSKAEKFQPENYADLETEVTFSSSSKKLARRYKENRSEDTENAPEYLKVRFDENRTLH